MEWNLGKILMNFRLPTGPTQCHLESEGAESTERRLPLKPVACDVAVEYTNALQHFKLTHPGKPLLGQCSHLLVQTGAVTHREGGTATSLSEPRSASSEVGKLFWASAPSFLPTLSRTQRRAMGTQHHFLARVISNSNDF
jgi:hypothetical protein